jgi:WD40 repeat protein
VCTLLLLDLVCVCVCVCRPHVRLWARVGAQWVAQGAVDEAHKRTVRAVAFSPDSKFLATASFDATTHVYERNDRTGGTLSSLLNARPPATWA